MTDMTLIEEEGSRVAVREAVPRLFGPLQPRYQVWGLYTRYASKGTWLHNGFFDTVEEAQAVFDRAVKDARLGNEEQKGVGKLGILDAQLREWVVPPISEWK
jgi:hypothetical protein